MNVSKLSEDSYDSTQNTIANVTGGDLLEYITNTSTEENSRKVMEFINHVYTMQESINNLYEEYKMCLLVNGIKVEMKIANDECVLFEWSVGFNSTPKNILKGGKDET